MTIGSVLPRRGSWLVLAGLVGLFVIEPSWAQQSSAYDMDLSDVGENIREQLPTLLAVLTAAGFLLGMALVISGLSKSNTLGNQRAAHVLGGQQTSYFGPGMSLVIGVVLMFVSTLVLVERTSFFGPDVKSVTIQGIEQLPE
jgi:hypothetical protein